jgi:hypothetical protein
MEPDTITSGMSTATARIAYDGQALREGYMDVRELAPALLEIGDLCERANEIINGDRAKVSINVRSDFKTGSFEVVLEIVQSALEQFKGYLFGDKIQDAKYILEWLGIGTSVISGTAATVLMLYKKYLGKPAPPDASVTINNVTINIDARVLAIYNDDAARSNVEGMLRPILREGIDVFEVRDAEGGSREQVVKEVARAAYTARRETVERREPPATDSTYTTTLEVVKVPFKDRLVWNFAQGAQRLSAEMKDPVFLAEHRAGKVLYGAGDLLVVKLRTKTFRTPDGLKVENEIEEVIEHIHPEPSRQLDILEPET